MTLEFQPMVYGNEPNYFMADGTGYVVAKTKFGWCAWADFGTKAQRLLTTVHSPNSKAGAIADCQRHDGQPATL